MKKTASMAFANIIGALVFIGVAVYAFVRTLSFKQFTNVPVGPEVFPQIMAIALAVCCLALIAQSLLKKKQTEAAPTLSLKNRGIQKMLISALTIALLVALWDIAGFWILGVLVVCATMWLLDMRNYKTMAIVSVLAVAVVWLLFWKVLGIEIPLGPFDFIY